jgi:hypothetical protein
MAGGFDTIAPAGGGAAVTTSNTDQLFTARALYIGGAGNLDVDLYDPVTQKLTKVTFTAVGAGTILPITTKRIYTSTSATAIVALT